MFDLFESMKSLLFLILLFIPLIYWINWMRNRRYNSLMAKIPGPPARNPLFGNLNMVWYNSCSKLVNPLDQICSALSVVYSDRGIFKFSCGPLQVVAIYRYDLAEDFLKNNANLEKPFEYQILYDWLGKGLLINNNSLLWKQRRKLLTPAFHFKILDNFLPAINENANTLVKNLEKYVGNDFFDPSHLLFACTLDTITETTLGVQINSSQNQNMDYFEAVHRMTQNFFKRLEKPWLYLNFIFYLTETGKQYKMDLKILHGLTQRVINERKQQILNDKQNTNIDKLDNKRKLALLDLLLDIHLKDNSLSLKDIREEVDTFMFAGHDTSACCLIWTFYLLGLHPEIQQRIYEELEAIVPIDEEITIDHIKQMTYTEAVLKESLRMYPPVPIISRKITEDIKIGEYVVPKGVSLYLLIGRLHKDPNVFPEPLKFKPERFLTENQTPNGSPFCFTPFSAGSRSCIGQKFALNELKIIIAKVIMKYSLRSLEDINEVIACNSIVSKPANGIKMRISLR